MARRKHREERGDGLLTATDVGRKLNLSRQHVYLLASTREIASIKLGGAVRFDPKDVEEFVRRHRRAEKKTA